MKTTTEALAELDARTGGPAFPLNNSEYRHDGMHLRDWFAGQVIAGFMTSIEHGYTPALVARQAYQLADAMLEARNKIPK